MKIQLVVEKGIQGKLVGLKVVVNEAHTRVIKTCVWALISWRETCYMYLYMIGYLLFSVDILVLLVYNVPTYMSVYLMYMYNIN